VLNLFGSSTPRTRTAESGDYKEILATHYVIDAESIYTVYRWTGEKYALSHHEFCDGVWIEYCNPIVITPIKEAASQRLTVARDATYLRSPKASAPRTELQSGTTVTSLGRYQAVTGIWSNSGRGNQALSASVTSATTRLPARA
jgi:hypothetical protein